MPWMAVLKKTACRFAISWHACDCSIASIISLPRSTGWELPIVYGRLCQAARTVESRARRGGARQRPATERGRGSGSPRRNGDRRKTVRVLSGYRWLMVAQAGSARPRSHRTHADHDPAPASAVGLDRPPRGTSERGRDEREEGNCPLIFFPRSSRVWVLEPLLWTCVVSRFADSIADVTARRQINILRHLSRDIIVIHHFRFAEHVTTYHLIS